MRHRKQGSPTEIAKENMKLRFFGLTTVLIIMFTFAPPISAATSHQNGETRIRWSTNGMYLSPNSYIEQEFVPMENLAFVDGATFNWTNGFHLDFCWQGTSGLTSSGDKCGFLGVGLGSKNGSNYYGNFDFVLQSGVDYSNLRPDLKCEKFNQTGFIGNVQSFYINCWKSVVLQMGTSYVVRVQWDSTNTANDNNWWSATLMNKKTNESVLIGKIKQVSNAYSEQLSGLTSTLYYNGEQKPCDSLPVYDLRVTSPNSSNNSGTFINSTIGVCARGFASASKEFQNYFSMRLGGANPETREPGYVKTPEPTSSATPIVSASPTPSPSKTFVKPASPVFSGIKISDNILNINVNIGSTQPDKVYLIAPKLSGNLEEKIFAEIVGDTAQWKIKFDPGLLKGNIPISFISEKDGQTSIETKIDYLLPTISKNQSGPMKTPNQPLNITSRIVGVDLLVTAKISTSGIAAATNASLYSKALGISRAKAIKGNLLTNAVIFSIPVNPTILSQKIDLNIFAANQIGDSKVSVSTFSIPVPKSPTYSTNNQKITTIICSKGSTIRTFVSKSCPPGWKVQ